MKATAQRAARSTDDAAWQRVVFPAIAGVVLLALWTLAVKTTGTKIFPTPADVAKAILVLAEQSLLWHYILDSLTRVFTGYLLAIVVGVPLGFLLGWSDAFARAINPFVQVLRPISPLAWMPLAVIWFGVGNAAPVFLIFLSSFFPIVVSAMNGVRNVPLLYLQAGRNFGLTTPQLMVRIVAPAVLPRIVVGLRLAFGIAWVVLVAAEMIAVDSGLGYLIIDARNAGKRYDLVVAGMLMIGVLGLIIDAIIRRIERAVISRSAAQ
ncbi:MAG: NitT/TauT family transport system permease protein [Acidobacteriota bacterium]|jgi:NitT/TauT family transport system permease protein|nr:NitT/TauT family transport system permease protein [Acidobacteriota bacterium]